VVGLGLIVLVSVGGAAATVVPQLWTGTATADAGSLSSSLSSMTLEPIAPTTPVPAAEAPPVTAAAVDVEDPSVPPRSGKGRRIVFDESDQRVWLVNRDESVERTYLVSGSRFDNLDPGTYSVQSKTRHATAFDASGTMEYFVRFATGFSEPIGFHSVPRDNAGDLEQTKSQLGTPLSAGCVRQWEPDAIALWDFAPIGTPVVVTP
jgi:lipoprotein-anchoring transpeptidase ErfK/SrfK